MQPLKPAEMQEANLTSMVLFMKRIDIAGLGHCDFMNRPGSRAVCWRGTGAAVHEQTREPGHVPAGRDLASALGSASKHFPY